jgi:hypothetical protein
MRGRVVVIAVVLSGLTASLLAPAGAAPPLSNCSIFPDDNYWHADVSDLPVHPRSDDYVASIGPNASLKADFGSGLWNGGPIGIPYMRTDASTRRVGVTFQWPSESDRGPYPIPRNPRIEGGSHSTGDRHVISVDTQSCRLYELYAAYRVSKTRWRAGSGAIFDLDSNAMRPAGWTSADAAGLPIFPGLVRWGEAYLGHIDHAIRFTAPVTQNAYVWPARHEASSNNNPAVPPMGTWFRLKADVDISGYSGEVRAILEALQTHGMILADNGSPWYLSGIPSGNWDNDELRDLLAFHGDDFEAVDVSGLMVDPNSGAVNP